jgi:hypothetical protein
VYVALYAALKTGHWLMVAFLTPLLSALTALGVVLHWLAPQVE